jgi:hypothetical protein
VSARRAAPLLTVGAALALGAGGAPRGVAVAQPPAREVVRLPRFFVMPDDRSAPVPIDAARSPVLQRRLALDLDGASRRDALAAISQRSGVRIFYVDNQLDLAAPVHLRAQSVTVAAALAAVLSGAGVDVVIAPDGSATLVRQRPAREAAQEGAVAGRVVDGTTRAPVAGARVEVVGTSVGAVTDSGGRFRLAAVPAGVVALRVRAVGFEPVVRTDVAVSTGKPVTVAVELRRSAVALERVTVRPSYFELRPDAPTSTQRLHAEEIRRAPGAQEDVVRAIAVLPGVAPTHLPRNDLIVRGGAPFENLFVVDGLDVPNVNHFGSQGSSGGPVSILELDFIRQADFSAGGFGARHGNRVGSVTELALREGNRERHAGRANLASTGFGVTAEGPLGSGSYLVGARRSYLDLLFALSNEPFLIRYWDAAAKVTQRLGRRDELSWTFVGASDDYDLRNDTPDDRHENAGVMTSDQDQYFTSLTWSRPGRRSLLQVTAGRVFTAFRTFQNDSLARRVFDNRSDEATNSLRVTLVRALTPRVSVELGSLAQYGGPLRYDIDLPGHLRRDSFGVPRPLAVDTSFGVWRAGGHGQLTARWGARLHTTLGVRADYHGYAGGALRVAPRLAASLDAGGGHTLTLSGGRYWQAPSFVWLAGEAGNPRRLRPLCADHAVFGVQRLVREDTKLQVEAYYKRYGSYPARLYRPQAVLSPAGFENVHTDIPFGLEPLTSGGKGRAYGAELLAQKRLSAVPVYGLVSVSLNRAEFAGLDGVWRRGAFDSPFIGNVTLGWRPDQRWDLGLRFRAALGLPTTPYVESGPLAGTPDFARYNGGDRFPTFHTLDLRVDRRWAPGRTQLTTYLDVQDVYNRDNPFFYSWDDRARSPQWERAVGFLPSVGLRLDF